MVILALLVVILVRTAPARMPQALAGDDFLSVLLGDAKKDMAYVKKANTETGAFDFVKTQTVSGL